MIAHASIPAKEPERVAAALAELWGGFYYPFPIVNGFKVAIDDGLGSGLEIVPLGHVGVIGESGMTFQPSAHSGLPTAVHLAIGVPATMEQILAVAGREGWSCWERPRADGGAVTFQVMETWIENQFMLELLTPEMQIEYVASRQAEYRQAGIATRHDAPSADATAQAR